jgi:hypothetical protein
LINEKNGKKCLISRNFGIVPQNVHKRVEKIVINTNEKVIITSDSSIIQFQENEKKESDLRSENDPRTEEKSDESFKAELREMMELTPQFSKRMSDLGLLKTWVSFFRLISQNRFPTDNISFHLFMDVVRFFSCSSTTNMKYSENHKMRHVRCQIKLSLS